MKIEPIGYLYHDAESADKANPLLHSTLIVFAADRKPNCRNETPLYTKAQMRQLGESIAAVCDPLGICVNERKELIKEMLP